MKATSVPNERADEARIRFWRQGPKLRTIFSSAESRMLWSFLSPHRYLLLAITILGLLLAVLEASKAVAVVGLIKGLVASDEELARMTVLTLRGKSLTLSDLGFSGDRVRLIGAIAGLLLSVTFLVAVVKPLISLISKKTQLALSRDVRQKTLDKLFTFDIDYFNQARSGELIFLMMAETNRFSTLVPFAADFVMLVGQALLYLALLIYMSWQMTVILFLAALVFVLFHIPIDARVKAKSWEANLSENRLTHFFHQLVYGMKLVKIGALEEAERRRYFTEHGNYERQTMKMQTANCLSLGAQEVVTVAILFLVLLYVYLFQDLKAIMAEPAGLIAYLFLLTRAIPSFTGLQRQRLALIGAYGPLARVFALLQTPDGSDAEKAKSIVHDFRPLSINELRCEGVSYSFNFSDRTLSDVTLEFHTGTTTALVGMSGSGKSTMLDILCSLRKPCQGSFLVDGEMLSGLRSLEYSRSVGYMNQEPIIFHDSVRENVKVFKPDATDEEIWSALKFAAADEFVGNLPQGLDTGLGERGWSVSGGERQRIGLARVFLLDPPILLLDEATNALDYKTENRIYGHLETMKSDKLVVVAAHRLSAIRNFDNIVVLERGRVAEQGNHEFLMSHEGPYRALVTRQVDSDPEAEATEKIHDGQNGLAG